MAETFDEFREHSRAAVRAWREGLTGLVPQSVHNFAAKGREGQKEALLATRSLLDMAIDRLETDKPPAQAKKKVRIEVE